MEGGRSSKIRICNHHDAVFPHTRVLPLTVTAVNVHCLGWLSPSTVFILSARSRRSFNSSSRPFHTSNIGSATDSYQQIVQTVSSFKSFNPFWGAWNTLAVSALRNSRMGGVLRQSRSGRAPRRICRDEDKAYSLVLPCLTKRGRSFDRRRSFTLAES